MRGHTPTVCKYWLVGRCDACVFAIRATPVRSPPTWAVSDLFAVRVRGVMHLEAMAKPTKPTVMMKQGISQTCILLG